MKSFNLYLIKITTYIDLSELIMSYLQQSYDQEHFKLKFYKIISHYYILCHN